jgi:nucleoside-diphosphate-sugar epimerase
MNVFVTGGTGFIGSHVVDSLIDDNDVDEIKCLVRNKEKWIEGKPYQKVDGDLHSIRTIEQALTEVDTIIHLAGVVKAPTQKEFDFANVQATEHLIRLANRSGVRKMVILSSLAAAGPSNGKALTEKTPMKPISMYGKSKKKMEEMIHEVADSDLSVTILRPPAVYGPREDQIYTLFKMMSFGLAPMVGDGTKPELSIIYVQDLVQAIRKSIQQNEIGVHTYFVSGEDTTNWNRISDIVQTVLGKKSIPIHIKPEWVKKIAGVVETTATFFGSYPVVNREKANEMILEWICDHSKAKKELNYQPQYSLEEGISRTLRWYKKHDWL